VLAEELTFDVGGEIVLIPEVRARFGLEP